MNILSLFLHSRINVTAITFITQNDYTKLMPRRRSNRFSFVFVITYCIVIYSCLYLPNLSASAVTLTSVLNPNQDSLDKSREENHRTQYGSS